jgi:hypothetical protein
MKKYPGITGTSGRPATDCTEMVFALWLLAQTLRAARNGYSDFGVRQENTLSVDWRAES